MLDGLKIWKNNAPAKPADDEADDAAVRSRRDALKGAGAAALVLAAGVALPGQAQAQMLEDSVPQTIPLNKLGFAPIMIDAGRTATFINSLKDRPLRTLGQMRFVYEPPAENGPKKGIGFIGFRWMFEQSGIMQANGRRADVKKELAIYSHDSELPRPDGTPLFPGSITPIPEGSGNVVRIFLGPQGHADNLYVASRVSNEWRVWRVNFTAGNTVPGDLGYAEPDTLGGIELLRSFVQIAGPEVRRPSSEQQREGVAVMKYLGSTR